jgi:D-glycero-D-manno-heptose 1,7-bisphosphate phosphatase
MPAVLLDRDGVINELRYDYVRSWEQFRFLPRALDALAAMSRAGLRLAVVTNQSAVGRGIVPAATLHEIHDRMLDRCERAGARIHGVFACHHTPGAACPCRKPKPGLLLQALGELEASPAECVVIGDSLVDLDAALAVGAAFILVRTGLGQETLAALGPRLALRVAVADDLWQAQDVVHRYFGLERIAKAA